MSTRLKNLSAGKESRPATVEPVRIGDRQGWRIVSDGEFKTVVTSESSAAAIKEAGRLYSGALKRLAKR